METFQIQAKLDWHWVKTLEIFLLISIIIDNRRVKDEKGEQLYSRFLVNKTKKCLK